MEEKQKTKKKMGVFGKIIIVLVIILAILMGTIFFFVKGKFDKLQNVNINSSGGDILIGSNIKK